MEYQLKMSNLSMVLAVISVALVAFNLGMLYGAHIVIKAQR